MKGSRNSVKMSNDKMMVCGAVVILIIVGLYFLCEKNNLLGLGNVENFESSPMELNNIREKMNPNKNDISFVLFYADWCPHCVSTKPDLSKLVKKHNNTKINGKNVKVQSCNCQGTDVEKEMAEDNNIEGYPTIKCIKNNETHEYSGSREFDELSKWVISMCA